MFHGFLNIEEKIKQGHSYIVHMKLKNRYKMKFIVIFTDSIKYNW
jgi:hypothetical protein